MVDILKVVFAEREPELVRLLAENADDERFVNVSARFENISMLVVSEDRALPRHHINCLAAKFTDSTN